MIQSFSFPLDRTTNCTLIKSYYTTYDTQPAILNQCVCVALCAAVTETDLYNRESERYRMGKALAKLFGKKDMRILMLGLDAAGKTSILL